MSANKIERVQRRTDKDQRNSEIFNGQKGFSFIQAEDGGPDVFVHVTALERAGISNLVEGQEVEYETQPDRRIGKTAVSNIRLA